MRKYLIHCIGLPLFTTLLFIFEFSSPQYYGAEFIWSFCISVVLWYGNGLIIYGLNRVIPWRNPAAPRIFIQIGLSSIFTSWVTYYSTQFLYTSVYHVHFSNAIFRKALFLFLILSWLYNAIYTGWHFFMQWRKSLVDREELKRQHLVSQYESLKNQINPHFLFNSINTLIGLIDEDKELAKKYGQHFSNVYRYILEKGNEERVSIVEELKIIDILKSLMKWRFGEAIQINVNIDGLKENSYIPPLSLQMLIENAIKHNAATLSNPLVIEIFDENDHLVVKNNVQLKKIKNTTHVGLDNIRKRYLLLTEKKVFIESNEQFIVKLPLLTK